MWSRSLVRGPHVLAPSRRMIRIIRTPVVEEKTAVKFDSAHLGEAVRSNMSLQQDEQSPQLLDQIPLIPKLSGRERRLSTALLSFSFEPENVKKIIENFRYKSSLYEFEPETVTRSVAYWIRNIVPDKSSRNYGFRPELFDVSESKQDGATLRETLTNSDPYLLLIDTDAMDKRLDNLRKIGFLSGKRDLWTVFQYAPVAFFLQDWAEFNRKFYYLQHRVLEWLIDVHRDPFPTPHPCVRHAKVMELPYDILKARFEFALRTGLKSPVAARKEVSKKKKTEVDFKMLFLSSVEDYLKSIGASAVTEEEYYFFETMVEEKPDEEDKTILEIVRLQSQGQKLVRNQRIDLPDEDDEDEDSDSDESQFHKTHKLKEVLPSGRKKVYKINFEADEAAARKRHEEKLSKFSD